MSSLYICSTNIPESLKQLGHARAEQMTLERERRQIVKFPYAQCSFANGVILQKYFIL